MEDTSETPAPVPKLARAKPERRKALGRRWNLLTRVEGPSVAPDFPENNIE
jgi:aminoglycoside phosphotransferase (APT) family kinase protein